MEKKIGTLIKVLPFRREIDPANRTYYDSLIVWYRDEFGVKKSRFISRAETPFYILKDKNSQEAFTPPMFIEKDKVQKVNTFSDTLYREIATWTDTLPFYDNVLMNYGPNSSNMKNLFKHNWIYDADMDVADRYIKKFHEEFEPDKSYQLHKAFFDIEVDLMPNGFKKDKFGNIGYMDFPDEEVAPCPINIITLINGKTCDVHTFIHRNTLNTSLLDFEKNVQTHIDELRKETLEEDGIALGSINVSFYPSEEEMILAYINKLHEIDPDILGAWNMSFDEITIMNRLKKIFQNKRELKEQGISGQDQMLTSVCDQKYMLIRDETGNDVYVSPKAYYNADKGKSFVDRIDTYTILDGINHFDQMLYFANIRKGAMRESYALDAIANEELGKEKLDYTGYTIKDLPWKNFPKFFKYNVKDVILLYLLEKKNLDFDLVQRLSEITNTRKEKVFKKTISLKNFVSKFAEEQGFIMNNNKNAQYGNMSELFDSEYLNKTVVKDKDEEYTKAFEKKENFGAYVANPALNKPCGIPDTSGNPSKFIFENVFDEDFSSLYPSIIMAYSLSPNGQLGKFFMLDESMKEKFLSKYDYTDLFALSKNEEAEGQQSKTDLGPTLVDSLISHNWSRIGEKFFDLPSTTELINDLKENKEKSKK